MEVQMFDHLASRSCIQILEASWIIVECDARKDEPTAANAEWGVGIFLRDIGPFSYHGLLAHPDSKTLEDQGALETAGQAAAIRKVRQHYAIPRQHNLTFVVITDRMASLRTLMNVAIKKKTEGGIPSVPATPRLSGHTASPMLATFKITLQRQEQCSIHY